MIEYVKGDATWPEGPGTKIVAHITNNAGAWGAGFVLALSKRWRMPKQRYLTDRHELGAVGLVSVEPDIFVANMCAQDNRSNVYPPVRYDALRTCLKTLREMAKLCSASIHMPRIGCGIGGGKWEEVEAIINDELSGLRVVVYDLP